jgi:transglutaminase superfamily protein
MRRRLSRLRSLSAAQWRVVLASLLLVPAVQTSLHLRGFTRTATALALRSRRPPVPTAPDRARPAAEAVALVAGRSRFGARCLGRSLVLWFLLRRRGVDAELVIGAEPPRAGELFAHAWVEVAGEPVNDAADVRERFDSLGLQLPRLTEWVK